MSIAAQRPRPVRRRRLLTLGLALPGLLLSSLVACASTPAREGREPVAAAERLDDLPVQHTPPLPENVATAVLVGSALLEAGDVRGALTYYGYAFERMPDDRDLGETFVEVALRAGQPRRALDALEQLQRSHPEDVDLAVQRVRILTLVGDADRAREESAELVRAHPEDFVVLDLHADMLMGEGDWQPALDLVDRMLVVRPEEPALWSRRALLLEALGRGEEAEESYRRALELDPTDTDSIDRISELLREQGRTDELIEVLEGLRERTEIGPLVQARLADLYLARGDVERTVELLTPLFERGELEARAQLILADLLASLDRRDEALRMLEDLVASGVRGGPVLRMVGELQLESGRLEDARESLRAAIEVDPDDADAHVSLLLAMTQDEPALFRGEADPELQSEFERVVDRAEQLVSTESLRQNYLLGAIVRRTGDHERAKPLLRRASALDPDNRQILYDLAITQESTGEYRAAASTLQRLLEIDPDDPHLMNFYGYLLADLGGKLDEAARLIRAAVEAEPDNGAYLDSLGWVLYRQGDLEGALEYLIEAANRLGDDPVVLEHLGDCLRDLGRGEEALRSYRRALTVGGHQERLESRIEALEGELRGGP